jgi:23S rRNA maturation-related 3'-5' exoribonuclease YhaM
MKIKLSDNKMEGEIHQMYLNKSYENLQDICEDRLRKITKMIICDGRCFPM